MSQDQTDVGAIRWFLLLVDTVTCLALFFVVSAWRGLPRSRTHVPPSFQASFLTHVYGDHGRFSSPYLRWLSPDSTQSGYNHEQEFLSHEIDEGIGIRWEEDIIGTSLVL